MELPLRALFEAPTVAELAARVERLRKELGSGRRRRPSAARRATAAAAALVRAAAALVPRSARAAGARSTTSRSVRLAARSTSARWSRRSPRSCAATRRCARRSPRRTGEPVQTISAPGCRRCRSIDLTRTGRAAARGRGDSGSPPTKRRSALRPATRARSSARGCCGSPTTSTCCCSPCTTSSADAGPCGVLVRELAALYAAFSRGRPSPLPELPCSTPTTRSGSASGSKATCSERQLGYWREAARRRAPVLELPTDRPRPAVRTHRGGACQHDPARRAERSRQQLGRREGATLFMTLLAAFKAAAAPLHRPGRHRRRLADRRPQRASRPRG